MTEPLKDPRPDLVCPVCGWNKWQKVMFGVGPQEEAETGASISAYQLPHEVKAAPFYCEGCGFVRMHVKAPGRR